MEQYIAVAVFSIGTAFLGIFTIIKSCDWLISLKYLSKDCFMKELKILSDNFSAKFATIESHKYLKEDIDEIKSKLNDIHDVIMTFTVNNFKDK